MTATIASGKRWRGPMTIWCVLEDDVELTPDFSGRLAAALDVSIHWGIMRLKSGGHSGRWKVGELQDGAILQDHRKQPGGTQGYLICRAVALALLEYAKRMIHPVDDMLTAIGSTASARSRCRRTLLWTWVMIAVPRSLAAERRNGASRNSCGESFIWQETA